MTHDIQEPPTQIAKTQSRGVSCDMTPEAILLRLDIVDELREFARELEEAKRQGSVKLDQAIATEAKNTQG
jgi:hypothetical protein